MFHDTRVICLVQDGMYGNATAPPLTTPVAAATSRPSVRNPNSADPPPRIQRASSRNLDRGNLAKLAPARTSIARQDSGYTDRPPPYQQGYTYRNIIRDDLTAPYTTAQLQAPRTNPAVSFSRFTLSTLSLFRLLEGVG